MEIKEELHKKENENQNDIQKNDVLIDGIIPIPTGQIPPTFDKLPPPSFDKLPPQSSNDSKE